MRTKQDFTNHLHTREVYKCGSKQIIIDSLELPGTSSCTIEFINTSSVLTVTGSFGNWVFCRPFLPSKDARVEASYWIEKLTTNSRQKLDKLDLTRIANYLTDEIDTENRPDVKSWLNELLESTDDYLNYLVKAFRDPFRPASIDSEDIPLFKIIPNELLLVFEAFETICKKINEK